MRADQKDGRGIVRRKRGDHSERSGKVRYADLGEKIITRHPVVKGCATVCAQRLEELVIRAPFLLMQCANLLCSSFRYQHACRHGHRLPAIASFLAFLVESERGTYIAGIHLRQAFR